MAVSFQDVQDKFMWATAVYEAFIYWLYADINGDATTGAGNLAKALAVSLAMPWTRNGRKATKEEITFEHNLIQGNMTAAKKGAGYTKDITELRLTQDGLRGLVKKQFEANDALAAKRFPDFFLWPADAQMALHLWMWAVGFPAAKWPKMFAALDAWDFATAAKESKIREEGNPGVAPRNVTVAMLFNRAANPQGDKSLVGPLPLAKSLPAVPGPGKWPGGGPDGEGGDDGDDGEEDGPDLPVSGQSWGGAGFILALAVAGAIAYAVSLWPLPCLGFLGVQRWASGLFREARKAESLCLDLWVM